MQGARPRRGLAVLAAAAAVTAVAATAPAGGSGPASVRSIERTVTLGTSLEGRPVKVVEAGDPMARTKVVVVCCIHGDEDAGRAVVQELEQVTLPAGIDFWLVEDMNPDGAAAGTRENARGVDLNRNFPWHWRKRKQHSHVRNPGRHPLSEPESRLVYSLLLRLRPQLVIWYHQALDVVDESGGSLAVEQRYAQLAGLPLGRLPRYPGSAASWANHRFPGSTSFVVELPPGELGTAAALRQASAVIFLARSLRATRGSGTPAPPSAAGTSSNGLRVPWSTAGAGPGRA
jgi:protein MpaA